MTKTAELPPARMVGVTWSEIVLGDCYCRRFNGGTDCSGHVAIAEMNMRVEACRQRDWSIEDAHGVLICAFEQICLSRPWLIH